MENQSQLFASLIRATKTYVGNDPLLPWLQGVEKIKEVLPREIANQKLPRFLEKCTQNFQNDKRYKNDLRFLQLWIQLLEFVPNRGEVLSVMEVNKIGVRHALYYQAYALHYEKLKKFREAEAMYKLGVQRLAEPAENLQESYDSFLQRMAHRNRRKLGSRQARAILLSGDVDSKSNGHYHFLSDAEVGIKGGGIESEGYPKGSSVVTFSDNSAADDQTCNEYVVKNGNLLSRENLLSVKDGEPNKGKVNSERESDMRRWGTVVDSTPRRVSSSCHQNNVRIEESLRSGSLHHGLVGPTINMKEVNAGINRFDESTRKNSLQGINRSLPADEYCQILPDENFEDQALNKQISIEGNDSSVPADGKAGGLSPAKENDSHLLADNRSEELIPVIDIKMFDSFQSSKEQTSTEENSTSILVKDVQVLNGIEEREQTNYCGVPEQIKCHKHFGEDSDSIASLPSKYCTEDTVIIRKFVDSAIVGDTREVEDAYHHGLIEPTINTKEALADINDMFGKPLNFKKPKSVNKAQRMQTSKQQGNIFELLVDEDLKVQGSVQKCIPSKTSEGEIPIFPLENDLQVFVDENLIYNSSDEANSFKNLESVQGLNNLADNSFKGSQNTCLKRSTAEDQGLSSVPVEFYQDGLAGAEKNGDSSKGKNGYRKLGNTGDMNMLSKSCSEETIVICKFIDSAIVGYSEGSEVAFHHVLLDPTVNTKEAMEEINNMFLKPLQFDNSKSRNRQPRAETVKQPVENFQIYADDDLQEQGVNRQSPVSSAQKTHDSFLSCVKDLEIFVDENLMNDSLREHPGTLNSSEDLTPVQRLHIPIDENSERMQQKTLNKCNAFENNEPLFPSVKVSHDRKTPSTIDMSFKSCNEDTIVIRKIVDSAIVDTDIEDACHHGLVEPTITTKEAMADINDMFCKTLTFDNTKRNCRPPKAEKIKKPLKGSWIWADEDMEKQDLKQPYPFPHTSEDQDSSVPLVNDFQIYVDENMQCEHTNKSKMKSCLSGDIVPVPTLASESSPKVQQKPSISCTDNTDEGVCIPNGCFQVFIDDQFLE